MNRTVSYCSLIAFAAVVLVLSAAVPNILSDHNGFLRKFVNHEFLNVLGVIVAITLASAANLHLKFNDIEERYKTAGGLTSTRRHVHSAAYWLISLFLIAIIIVVIKPHFVGIDWAESLFNGTALLVLFWHVLFLISLTRLIFAIKPVIKDDEDDDGPR